MKENQGMEERRFYIMTSCMHTQYEAHRDSQFMCIGLDKLFLFLYSQFYYYTF